MAETARTPDKIQDLRGLLDGRRRVLVVLQDNPDPDALGAATAFRRVVNALGDAEVILASGGHLSRAENRALLHYLELDLHDAWDEDPAGYDAVAVLDAQPGQGNVSLPEDFRPDIVIDHHPRVRESRALPFTDIRSRYGATSTILFEYLREVDVEPKAALATALLYGIRSDTEDFGMESHAADIEAAEHLYRLANKKMLGAIQRARVPTQYFRTLAVALDGAYECEGCLYATVNGTIEPDMLAEIADLLMRHEDARSSLCWGYRGDRALLSLRTDHQGRGANVVVKRIVAGKGSGGGHFCAAAGQIPLPDGAGEDAHDRLNEHIRRAYFDAQDVDGRRCRKLI
ncbi:MAG: DHH family phosphoesterase [Phycisphaerae bacterium]